jgi:HAD superfamily hydrolase (TIGR01509 family)
MKQCVIFDLDSVIIDSVSIHLACEREMFRLMGITLTAEEYNSLVGLTDKEMWQRIEQTYPLPIQIPEIIQLKKVLYMEYLKQETSIQPTPYAWEFIAELHDNGLFLAIASSSSVEQINYILDSFRLKGFFQCIVSAEDINTGKPDPEIFLKAADLLSVNPKACIVIEDLQNGVKAAKKAGMKCIGYLNRNRPVQELREADLVINSFSEISVVPIKGLLWDTDYSY